MPPCAVRRALRLRFTLFPLVLACLAPAFATPPRSPLTITGSPQLLPGGRVQFDAVLDAVQPVSDVTVTLATEAGDETTLLAGGRALAESGRSADPHRPGLEQRRFHVRFAPGLVLRAVVTPRGEGRHSVRVMVNAPGPGQDVWGDDTSFFYRREGNTLLAGWPDRDEHEGLGVARPDFDASRVPASAEPAGPVVVAGTGAGSHADTAHGSGVRAPDATTGLLTVRGSWWMFDQKNTHIPQRERLVQLLNGSATVIAQTNTDVVGFYEFPPVANPGTFYVRVWARTSYNRVGGSDTLRVHNSFGNDFTYATSTVSGVPDGTYDMGAWDLPDGATNEPAFWAFNAMQIVWRYFYFLHGDGSHAPGSMSAIWYPGSTDGTYYSGGGEIHLMNNDPVAPHIVAHEAGHNVMYNAYNGWWPVDDCPAQHYLFARSGLHCGWTEGWADWTAIAALNDPKFGFPSGSTTDLEDTSGFNEGDWVEGNVAGAMWDWIDATNEMSYDMHTDPPLPLWDTVWNHRDQTFCDYFDSTRDQGVKRSRDNELRQNSITSCTTCLQDFSEQDNTCAAAKNFPVGSFSDQSTLCSDPDYKRVDVQKDWNYVFETDELGAYGDSVLTLFDTTCAPENTLAYNDDKQTSRWPQASRIDWRSDRTGTVFLEVWNFDGYGPNRSYDLSSTRYCATPVVPAALTPSEGASVCGPNVTLTWAADGSAYNVVVDGGYRFSCMNLFTPSCPLTNLAPGPHWWQIESTLACGSVTYSPQFHFEVFGPGDVPAEAQTLDVRNSVVSWSAVSGAMSCDLVRGDLGTLLASGGDFSAATTACLGSALPGNSVPFTDTPPAGAGLFLLARARGCGGPGSYDSGSISQVGSRDAGVNASAGACP